MKSISKITVRYAETDQMGIAHHANYPVWYEVGRSDLIRSIGIRYSALEEMGILVPLMHLESTYRRPCRYEDRLEVHTYIKSLSYVKMEIGYEIYIEGEDTPINTGATTHAITDKQLRPINLKRVQPELYARMQAMAAQGE
ncbi:MAG: acyl-CoA thioesterase [Christensenellaceae bacterium]|nr:acyl-CoA thioesterase [Christensenellaceae bacterium]